MSFATITLVSDSITFDMTLSLIPSGDADQTCPECGTKGIQLAPLQRDVSFPWISSIYSCSSIVDGSTDV